MRSLVTDMLSQGELHRTAVVAIDQASGYQPPAEAPQPVTRSAAPEPPQTVYAEQAPIPEIVPPLPQSAASQPLPIPEEPAEDEPPALVFELPTKRRRGRSSDQNYRGTSFQIHKELWSWAKTIEANDGYDLGDLCNLGLAHLKARWEDLGM